MSSFSFFGPKAGRKYANQNFTDLLNGGSFQGPFSDPTAQPPDPFQQIQEDMQNQPDPTMEQGAITTGPNPPTRVESLQQQLDAKPSTKNRILQALIPAAGMAVAGLAGGEAGLTGAGQAVQRNLADQQAAGLAKRKELLTEMENERNRQERGQERTMTLQSTLAGQKSTAATAAANLAEQVRQHNLEAVKPVTVSPGSTLATPQGQSLLTVPDRPVSLSADSSLVQPETGKVLATGAPKPPTNHPITIDLGGKPVSAVQRINQDGTSTVMYQGKEMPDAKIYHAPNVSLLNRDEMIPVLDRVAHSLAGGIDKDGKAIPPDLTSLKQISSMRGDQRILLYDKIKQLNPKYNTSEIDRKIKMMDWAENGKGSDQIQSYNTFLGHAGELVDAMESVNLYNSPAFNKPINWLRQHVMDSPEYSTLLAALDPPKKEFESFLLNNRALYSEDRADVDRIISENSTPAMMLASIKQMGKTAKVRGNEINTRYKKVIGSDIEDMFSPEAIHGAQRIGLSLGKKDLKSDINSGVRIKDPKTGKTGIYQGSKLEAEKAGFQVVQ
jgi:hypothetical protein